MSTITSNDISNWLTDYISKLVQLPVDQIQPDAEFTSFGIDSSGAVGLAVDLSDWAGISLDPTLVYDYPTIEALSEYAAQMVHSAQAGAKSTAAA